MQKQKNSPATISSQNEELSARFEEIKSRKTKRIVHLLYKSCCGCGCTDSTIQREVDSDSDLQNGDRITKLLPEDIAI